MPDPDVTDVRRKRERQEEIIEMLRRGDGGRPTVSLDEVLVDVRGDVVSQEEIEEAEERRGGCGREFC